MAHVRDLIPKDAAKEIERAVAEAEAKSSAQIVVVLAGRSGRYHRAADMFGLSLGLLAVASAWALWQELVPNPRDWDTGSIPAIGLPAVLLVFAVWFIAGAAAATHWPVLARPFMTRAERAAAVRRRGFEAFHRMHVGATSGHTGLLMYVSLFERTVWVCPDDAIAAKLGPTAWQPISDVVAEGFRTGRPGPALARAVSKAGEILAAHCPRGEGGRNELPDGVRVLDGRTDSDGG